MDQDGTFNISSTPSFSVVENPAPAKPASRKKLFIVGGIIVALIIAIIVAYFTTGKAPAGSVKNAWSRIGNYVISGTDKSDPLPQEMPDLKDTVIAKKMDAGYYKTLRQIANDIEPTIQRTNDESYNAFSATRDRIAALEYSCSLKVPTPYIVSEVGSYGVTMEDALATIVVIPDELLNDTSRKIANYYSEYAEAYIKNSIAMDNCLDGCSDEDRAEAKSTLADMDIARLEYYHELDNLRKNILETVYDEIEEVAK